MGLQKPDTSSERLVGWQDAMINLELSSVRRDRDLQVEQCLVHVTECSEPNMELLKMSSGYQALTSCVLQPDLLAMWQALLKLVVKVSLEQHFQLKDMALRLFYR